MLRFLAAASVACAGCAAAGAMPQMADADSVRAAFMAEELAMNAPGMPAADFSIEMADGTRTTLAAFRGKPLLLVLFDADCDDCRRELELLGGAVPPTLAVLAVYAEGEAEMRARALAEVPDGWMAAFDIDGVYSAGLYSPEFTPGIYLLDSRGCVVARGSKASEMAFY
ncbi:MAG: redoxin domain-containing protein [Muribaculaceae bacterium]|nr:redoxin domain-containing protein [Muribaculaceae bacterium]